jgi:predicted transcriptional regulator
MPSSVAQHRDVETIRSKIYLFHNRFYTQEQIAHTLNISQATVSYHLKVMRHRDAAWSDEHRDLNSPAVRGLRAAAVNQVKDCLNELWTQYSASEKPGARAGIIVQILGGLDQLHSLLGVQDVGERMWLEQQTALTRERLTAATDQLRQLNEARMLDRIRPLPSGSNSHVAQ